MKIFEVASDDRHQSFNVRTHGRTYTFPYVKTTPTPSGSDPVIAVAPDPELGNEGFTYRLRSGGEGSVHIDAVREFNLDPRYLAELMMYRLSVEANLRMETSGETVRNVATALHTSPTQLYRLLDTTNYTKSLRQLLELLDHFGVTVEFQLTETSDRKDKLTGSGIRSRVRTSKVSETVS